MTPTTPYVGGVRVGERGLRRLCKDARCLLIPIHAFGGVRILPRGCRASLRWIETMDERARARFWAKVAVRGPHECWLWQAARNRDGYGHFGLDGKTETASRISWVLANGPVPEGRHVLHTCDTPACVNPSHLWIGTNTDNIQDRNRKGRTPRGEHTGQGRKTHCPQGHKYTPENTLTRRGFRECRFCKALRNALVRPPVERRRVASR